MALGLDLGLAALVDLRPATPRSRAYGDTLGHVPQTTKRLGMIRALYSVGPPLRKPHVKKIHMGFSRSAAKKIGLGGEPQERP